MTPSDQVTVTNLNDPNEIARAQTVRHCNAPKSTQAFVHAGQWVADCPYPSCYNCEPLEIGATMVHCRNCNWVGEVIWPAEAEGISVVLARRPVPGTRFWAPAGHRQAIACGFPEGQTVADLIDENEANL